MPQLPLHKCDESVDWCCPRGDELELALVDEFGEPSGSILNAGFILNDGTPIDLGRIKDPDELVVHVEAINRAIGKVDVFEGCEFQLEEALGQLGAIRLRFLGGEVSIEFVYVVDKPIEPSREQLSTVLKYYKAALKNAAGRGIGVPPVRVELAIIPPSGRTIFRNRFFDDFGSKQLRRALNGEIEKYLISVGTNRKDRYEAKAVDEFGETTSILKAGFVLSDGTMLDFSEGRPTRIQDHRQVEGLIDDDAYRDIEQRSSSPRTERMYHWMAEVGAVRVNAHPGYAGIEFFAGTLSNAQKYVLARELWMIIRDDGDADIDVTSKDHPGIDVESMSLDAGMVANRGAITEVLASLNEGV